MKKILKQEIEKLKTMLVQRYVTLKWYNQELTKLKDKFGIVEKPEEELEKRKERLNEKDIDDDIKNAVKEEIRDLEAIVEYTALIKQTEGSSRADKFTLDILENEEEEINNFIKNA